MLFFICDDNSDINSFIRDKIYERYGKAVDTVLFTDANVLTEYITNEKTPDAIIMDICVANVNGITSLKGIKNKIKNTPVIFITGYMEYCQDIFFDFNPWGLLTKPIDEEKLYYHIDNLVAQYKRKHLKINITFAGERISANLSDIVYVESRGRKTIYHFSDNKILQEYIKLDDAFEKLKTGFLRCHKSYSVNIEYIKNISDTEIILQTGDSVPISRSYKDKARRAYFEYSAAEIGL